MYMSEKVKVSVVLPSLNVVQYIEQCIESVRKQTLKDIEIICVDAGSTDGTYELLQKYASEDSRIKLIFSERKSYGYQVNLGMRIAKGEYVAIVDTDDMLKEDMYHTLYEMGTKENADFVKADYIEFTIPAEEIQMKKTIPIVTDETLYHRILNIEEAQQCFHPQTTATWSGIYKRSFLEENDICHNETEGASYQDAGFFLQTYMFAKRAYFVNESFYMYRVDNPNSSVVNRNKVYCICDEFDFVRDVLQKNKQFETFNGTLSWIFFKKYKRNIERIAEEFRSEFLEKFARDFNELEKNGFLLRERFSDEEWNELKEIQRKSSKFYEEILTKKTRFLEDVTKLPKVIIYGAGKVGKEILRGMQRSENVVCFATTEKLEDGKTLEGKEIKCIEDLDVYREDAHVVIAVMHAEYQKKMIEKVTQMGFENVITVPYGVFDY